MPRIKERKTTKKKSGRHVSLVSLGTQKALRAGSNKVTRGTVRKAGNPVGAVRKLNAKPLYAAPLGEFPAPERTDDVRQRAVLSRNNVVEETIKKGTKEFAICMLRVKKGRWGVRIVNGGS